MSTNGRKAGLHLRLMNACILLSMVGTHDELQAALIPGELGYVQATAVASASCDPSDILKDISTSGTALIGTGRSGTTLADDEELNVALQFDFAFYGSVYNALTVANNGGVLFGQHDTVDLGAVNQDLPAANLVYPAILPFWDDLDDERGQVYYETEGTTPNRIFHVQWNRPHFQNTGDGSIKMILYEGLNTIMFAYPDIDFGDANFNDGVSATVGIQKNPSEAIKTSFNESIASKLSGASAECFAPKRILYTFGIEKASNTPACSLADFITSRAFNFDSGEDVRFCIFIENTTDETLTSHKVTILGGSDVRLLNIPPGEREIVHFSGPIQNSINVPITITSYGNGIAEGDFQKTGTFTIKVNSILDYLPAIITGALKNK